MSQSADYGAPVVSILSAWERDHEDWLSGIVLDAAIWDDDHESVVAMDIGILRKHLSAMLARLSCECCHGGCPCGGKRVVPPEAGGS